jgi:hypothetical protein
MFFTDLQIDDVYKIFDLCHVNVGIGETDLRRFQYFF